MSDTTKTSGQASDEVETPRHDGARNLADAAARADAEGDDTRAEDLLNQAMHTDPDALANALAEEGPALAADRGTASDEDVAAMSREIHPKSDAPSRAGITGSGSGADDM